MNTFICQNCGAMFPSWVGRCSECGQWNCVIEEVFKVSDKVTKKVPKVNSQSSIPISDIKISSDDKILTNISELDRVLGGGIVKGSVILIAGEPGIGKSTLLLQISSALSTNKKVLYVSGEESASQIALRAKRLKINSKNLLVLNSTDTMDIASQIQNEQPCLSIIDSVQTLEMEGISSSAGSVSQVKESALYLIQIAKSLNIPTIFVGQVTKEGSVAGPKILEHMVDTVLYFEGEQNKAFRVLRATKNRFGPTNEIGIFEMKEEGIVEVKNPSKVLLDESSLGLPGSVVTCPIEGTRPVLIEIQALVSYSKFPSPKRVVTGIDYNRASVIIGVLEKKAGLKLSENDIYLNIASGIYSGEPAIDLAIALAIATNVYNKAISPKTVVLGEIGLTGEVRAVPNLERRLKESLKMGFSKAIVPFSNTDIKKLENIEIVKVSNIKEAIEKGLKL